MAQGAKSYDQRYFDRWYRGRRTRIEGPAALRRRVAMALAITERFLERPLQSALDIGCGEGRWRAELRRLRPRLTYVGIDPSSYVVERFGKRRNLCLGGFGELAVLGLDGPFDLVICADVLHYLSDAELDSGLPELVRLTGGAAYLEVLTAAEPIEGDLRGLVLRPPGAYASRLMAFGMSGVGCHVWLGPALSDAPSALEQRSADS